MDSTAAEVDVNLTTEELPYVFSVSEGSIVSIDTIGVDDSVWEADDEGEENKDYNLSCNNARITKGTGLDILVSDDVQGSINLGEVLVVNKHTKTGSFNFAINEPTGFPPLIKEVEYTINGELSPEVSSNFADFVSFEEKRTVEVVPAPVPGLPADAVTLSVNESAVPAVVNLVDGEQSIALKAEVAEEFNNNGTLTINTTSENIIKGVTFKFDDNNRKYDEDGKQYVVDNTESVNAIVDDAPISASFLFAQTVDVWVSDEDTVKNPEGKYVYTITYKEAEGKDKTEEVAKDGVVTVPVKGSNTSVLIGVKQVKFDSTVSFNIVSNNLIDEFTVDAFDNDDTKVSSNKVSAKGETASVSFEKASYVKLTGFKLAGAEIDDDKVAIKLNNEIVAVDDLAGKKFELNKDGITIDVKAVAKEDKTIYVKNNLDISNSIKSVSYNEIDPDKTDSEIKSAEISDDTVTFKGVLEGNKIKVTGFDLAADYFYLENLTKYNDTKSVNEVVKPDKDGSYDLGSVDGSYSINTKTYKLASIKSDETLSSDSVFNVKKAKNDDPDVTLGILEQGSDAHVVKLSDPALELPIYALASTETTKVPTLIVTTSENDLRYYSVDNAVIKLGKNTVTAEVARKNNYVNNIYHIKIPYTALYDFFKNAKANDKIDVTLTQTMRGKDQSVSYTENGSSILSGISDVVLTPRIANGTKIPYGDTLNVRAILKNHYKLKSVSVNGTAVKDSDIALFTGDKGYNIKSEGPIAINFVTEAQANIKVEKLSSSESAVDITNSTGKYTIDPYNVPVRISYNLGSEPQSIISCNAVNKAKTDVTAKVLNKEAWSPYLLFSGAAVSGDSITVTLSANGLAEQTLVFNVAKAGSVKLSKTEDAIPVGGKATYKISKSGSIDYTLGTVSANISAGISEDGKTLTVKSTKLAKDEIGKQYTITLVDRWNSSEVLATLKVKLSDAITDSKAPTATVTNVTSYKMDVKLGTSVDTTIEGLYYKVFVSANTVSEGSALVDSITKYVKVTGKTDNATIDLRRNTGDETASDASRKYTVTASLIQYNGDPAIYDAAKLVAEGKNKTTTKEEKVKEGGIYETRLKLSKIKGSPSNMFANMGVNNEDAPFALSVVYSKNTSEQKLARVELLDENGNIIEFIGAENSNGRITAKPTGDFLKADDREIKFLPHKYGTTEELPVGNYVIKAYAQEPRGVEVTAQFKVKVVRAIVSINLVPETEILYKTAGKSAKTSITASDGNTDKKASKVKWSIVNGSADVLANVGYFKLSNGKLTVDKRFTPKADNTSTITIRAKADDWSGNPTYANIKIKIYNQTNLAINLTWNGGTTDGVLNPTKTYYVRELFDDSGEYAVPYKYNAARPYFYDRNGGVSVKFTVTGAAKLDKTGSVYFVKPGVMTIKGTALDGSGRKFPPLKINIAAAPKGIAYSLYGFPGDGEHKTKFEDMDVISSNTVASTGINYGSPSQVLYLDVFGKLDNGNTSYIDTKVKAVGAKVKAVKNHPGLYAVTVTNKKTVLTITYNNNQTADVTFTNAAFNDTKTKVKAENVFWGGAKKAPAGVVYSNIDFSNVGDYTEYNNISVNKVEYTITDNKGGAINGIDTAMVEVVMDKKHEAQKIKDAITDQLGGVNANAEFYYFAVTNGKFAIDYVNNDKTFNIKPGSYNLMITPGKMVDGKFTALGKSFKQKVAFKKAPAARMKLEKTTLDFGAGGKTGQVSVNIAVKNPSNYINKTEGITFTAEPKSANIKGKINNFYRNFTVVQDATSSRLVFTGTTQNLTTADKNEMSGYITYTYQGYDGRVRSANFKVTIKLKKDGKLSI